MEVVGKERYKKDNWMEVSMALMQPICDKNDKNNKATFTSTWGERMVSMFVAYLVQLTCILDAEDGSFIAKSQDPSLHQFPIVELNVDFKGWTNYYSGVTLLHFHLTRDHLSFQIHV